MPTDCVQIKCETLFDEKRDVKVSMIGDHLFVILIEGRYEIRCTRDQAHSVRKMLLELLSR